jgi:catechol 2,3-dioxygenase-like lactoylglutathione lyase family enzyme
MMRFAGFALACVLATATPALAQERPTGLVGVKIAVDDYERATRFYEILGMAPGVKYNALEWQLTWKDPAQGVPVIMVRDPDGRIKVAKGGGFLMVSVADVAATIAQLKAAGFAVESEAHVMAQATIQMIKDPDGNTIELLGPTAEASASGVDHDHDH